MKKTSEIVRKVEELGGSLSPEHASLKFPEIVTLPYISISHVNHADLQISAPSSSYHNFVCSSNVIISFVRLLFTFATYNTLLVF